MEDLDKNFEKAQKDIFTANYVSETDKLFLYGLFKQAKFGDCTSSRPSILKFRDYKKWESWDERRGLKSEYAKRMYIARVKEILENQ